MENIAGGRKQLAGVFTQQINGHLSPQHMLDSSSLSDNRSAATLRRRGIATLFKKDVDGVKNHNTIEEKAYISSESSDGYPTVLLWREDLYGIPRTAVHGKNSICVVARKEDVSSLRDQAFKERRCVESEGPFFTKEVDPEDLKLMGYWNECFSSEFGNAAIYEVEEHAGPYFESFKKPRGINVPFSVVSSNLGGINMMRDKSSGDEQASSVEYDVDNAIKFLQEAMNSGKTFTFIETLKTAKSALDRMFRKKLKPDEIQVFDLRYRNGRGGRKRKRGMTREVSLALPKKSLYDFEVVEIPTYPTPSIQDYFKMYNINSEDTREF